MQENTKGYDVRRTNTDRSTNVNRLKNHQVQILELVGTMDEVEKSIRKTYLQTEQSLRVSF